MPVACERPHIPLTSTVGSLHNSLNTKFVARTRLLFASLARSLIVHASPQAQRRPLSTSFYYSCHHPSSLGLLSPAPTTAATRLRLGRLQHQNDSSTPAPHCWTMTLLRRLLKQLHYLILVLLHSSPTVLGNNEVNSVTILKYTLSSKENSRVERLALCICKL